MDLKCVLNLEIKKILDLKKKSISFILCFFLINFMIFDVQTELEGPLNCLQKGMTERGSPDCRKNALGLDNRNRIRDL